MEQIILMELKKQAVCAAAELDLAIINFIKHAPGNTTTSIAQKLGLLDDGRTLVEQRLHVMRSENILARRKTNPNRWYVWDEEFKDMADKKDWGSPEDFD